jgi:hypothetical protein
MQILTSHDTIASTTVPVQSKKRFIMELWIRGYQKRPFIKSLLILSNLYLMKR